MTTAVSIKHLTKSYKIYESAFDRTIAPFKRTDTARRFVALKDLTLDFPQGESIAILGKNGSGKSTLLKIITGVATPTKGSVEVNGRISALLELQSGFDEELTGVENIYLRALVLGIPEEDIEKAHQDIVKFADIGDHINQPVRTYSSGMKARLGFAVSVNINPDILIVDEALSVGDTVFRIKCIERMAEFRRSGKTILFVSHQLNTVKAFCTKALWLKEGIMQSYGDIGPITQEYDDYLRAERLRLRLEAEEEGQQDAPQIIRDIIDTFNFRMYNAADKRTDVFKMGEDIYYEFDYEVKRPLAGLRFCYLIRNAEDVVIFQSDEQDDNALIDSSLGCHRLKVRIKNLSLLAGEYKLSGGLWDVDSILEKFYADKKRFYITQDKFIGAGIIPIDYDLQVLEAPAPE